MITMPLWLNISISLASFSTAASGAEAIWPRLRGPNGDGISQAAALPLQWTTNDYNWHIKLPGVGHSSPVVWGARLYAICGDPETGKRIILCVDTTTGRAIWQRDYESKTYYQSSDNSYATATPAADAGGVVLTWTTPDEVTLLALDNDGRQIWRRDLGGYIGIWGSGASPVIIGDLVVLDNDQEDPKALPASVYAKPGAPQSSGTSFLIGVDRKTGKTRWQLDRSTTQAAYVTPCVYRPEKGGLQIVLASTAHGVTGVDAASGTVDWELDRVERARVDADTGATNRQMKPLFTERCVSSPIVADGLVFASEGRGSAGLRTVAVRPGSKAAGAAAALVYEITKSAPLVPTPLAKDGRLYLWADNGMVACARVATGEVLWREKIDGSFYSSPVWVNERLYCVAKNGDVVILAAADKFQLLGRVSLGEKCYATPAVAGGVMYLRTYSQLFSLGGTKP